MKRVENDYTLEYEYVAPAEAINGYEKTEFQTDPIKLSKGKPYLCYLITFILIVQTLCIIYLFFSGPVNQSTIEKVCETNTHDENNQIIDLKKEIKNIQEEFANMLEGNQLNTNILEETIINLQNSTTEFQKTVDKKIIGIPDTIKTDMHDVNNQIIGLKEEMKNIQNELTKKSEKNQQGTVPLPTNYNIAVNNFFKEFCKRSIHREPYSGISLTCKELLEASLGVL